MEIFCLHGDELERFLDERHAGLCFLRLLIFTAFFFFGLLTIQFLDPTDVPETKIELGKSLNPNDIREGTDVYFDCLVNAQPAAYKVEWRHNVS